MSLHGGECASPGSCRLGARLMPLLYPCRTRSILWLERFRVVAPFLLLRNPSPCSTQRGHIWLWGVRACVRACAELCQAKNGSAEAKTAGVASDIDAVARSAALEASIRRDFRASSAGSSARARRSPGTGRRNGTGTENARD